MSTSTLTLGSGGGALSLDPAGRAGRRLRLDRLARSIDEPSTLEFHQFGQTSPVASWKCGTPVSLAIGGTPLFKGEIASVHPGPSPSNWSIGYACRDLKAMAAQLVPLTNPNDGTGVWEFNLPQTDENYVHAWAGQSVGGILQLLLDGHASQLSALGLAATCYVASDLSALTLVPPQPVTVAGMSLINAISTFLDQWAGNVAFWADYQAATGDWRFRFVDTTTFPVQTLTLGSDPIDWPSFSRDTSGCFTRVIVRGRAIVEGAYASTSHGTLVPDWTSTGTGTANQQATWTWAAYIQPQNGSDWGTVSTVGSTTATLTSASAVTSIATNAWANQQASIALINPVATDLTQQEFREITANTAMGGLHGSYTVTLDHALVNGGYTKYFITGNPTVGGLSDVWRRYKFSSTHIAQHLVNRFPYPVNYSNNGIIYPTSTPLGFVVSSLASMPAQIELDLVNGQVRFVEPVVKLTSTQAELNAGGSQVVTPDDVQVFVPYSRGTMTAQYPASGDGGTASTVEGLSRPWYLDCPQWLNQADASLYQQLAQMKWATVCNTVVTGEVVYNGLYAPALTPGISLNIPGNGFTTGWESLGAPVRTAVLNWTADGANLFETTLSVSNRRKQATGDNYYVHPAFTGSPAWEVDHGGVGPGQGTYDAGEGVDGQAGRSAAEGPRAEEAGQATEGGGDLGFDPGAFGSTSAADAFPASRMPSLSAAQAFGYQRPPSMTLAQADALAQEWEGGNDAPSPPPPPAKRPTAPADLSTGDRKMDDAIAMAFGDDSQ